MEPKDTRVDIRMGAVLRGQLAEEAGEYGNIATVARKILERYFAKKGKRRPRRDA